MLKRTFLLFICLIFSISMVACGKDEKIQQFHTDMTQFLSNIQDISLRLENIDPLSETAVEDMLSCLDDFEIEFTKLSEMDVPDEFPNIKTLSTDALNYMTQSNKLYHEVYQEPISNSNDETTEYVFDEAKADAALEYYNRAMTRISYISLLLQGELPEGENIDITDEEVLDFEPITE